MTNDRLVVSLVAFAVVLVVASGLVAQLFFPSSVGLENNGDGYRVWCAEARWPIAWKNVVWDTPRTEPSCSVDPAANPNAFSSSSRLLNRTVEVIDGVMTQSSDLDIRTLGILSVLLLATAAGAAIFVLPGGLGTRAALVLLTFLLWADVGLVTYFNSYYLEPMVFIASAALLVCVGAYVRWTSWQLALVVGVAAALAATSKPQMLVVLAPTSALLLALPLLPRRRDRRTVISAVATIALLFVVAVAYLGRLGSTPSEINQYNAVFHGVLVEASDADAALAEMGLSEDLAFLAGTHYWHRHDTRDQPWFSSFAADSNRLTVPRYLATHPGTFATMFQRTVDALPSFRVDYLSNYPDTHRLANRPEPMTALLRMMRHVLWPLLPIVLLGAAIWAAVAIWMHRADDFELTWPALTFLTASTSLLGLVLIPVADGYFELEKHTVPVVWWLAPLGAGSLVFLAGITIGWVRTLRSQRAISD